MPSTSRAARLASIAGLTTSLMVFGLRVGAADAPFTRADADRFHQKVTTIVQQSVSRATSRRARMTPVTENEVNAYLRHHLRDYVPPGIAEPTIDIIGDGRVSGSAIVDLDAVSRTRASDSWFDPVRLLSGRVPVTLTGVLTTTGGTGRFNVESATISGVAVPKPVLQQVISYYSRTPDDLDGINLDDAFGLPADIQEIRVRTGEAIVVQ